ncbi:acyl-CoA dehydrogenase family protein [Limnohabitans radicicola]|uniref:Acyl-CoA dehydrogenase family protein n=1 Tax=Limnohabitans radicicola TaxID=2771427 RepID=A0A927FG87_9BURK|nr:acyl-CoA dehydrogenase family protein [Limnohabitans radicicola]MBD8050073.1 acyl-CoA dehydrogenase family protein [Limnohabitans radicicola]
MSPYTAAHEDFRATVRQFVEREIAPHVNDWDEAAERGEYFPRSLYKKAADIGLLAIGYPEAYGGIAADNLYRLIVSEEVAKAGSGGVLASLFSHTIGLPPVVALGSEALKQRIVPEVLAGHKIAALAITEPGGGSDVAAIRTTARLDGGEWVLNGEKVFITSGLRADWITVAVRTGGPGASGLSLIAVPGDAPGLSRTPLRKMGWWSSDTAHLRFDDCRVPHDHLIGEEGAGFRAIMTNFNTERLTLAVGAWAFAKVCYDDALDWARQRKTFGAPLIERQVIRHKLVDMQMKIASCQPWLEQLAQKLDAGDHSPRTVAELCMLKNHTTQTMQFCADQAVQILGGMGFMRGTRVERIYREVKVMMIGGGAEEIMKELAGKQLGI